MLEKSSQNGCTAEHSQLITRHCFYHCFFSSLHDLYTLPSACLLRSSTLHLMVALQEHGIRKTLRHTHTHTLVILLIFTTARTGYVAPIQGVSQQEVTRLVVPLAVGHQLYLHIRMVPSVHWGTHLWACKTHEMREMEYSLE